MIKFPDNFFWGAATSAYQVEGNNTNSDWWEWEIRAGLRERSGQACRHYELFKDDLDLARGLNHNAHRFSVEWSRVEPEEGKFSDSQIRHYEDVVVSLRERGIEPIVSLHHFTNPIWFANSGGWLNKKAGQYFLRYTERIVGALADKVRFWVTINEPMVYAYHAYILGLWPPQERSISQATKVTDSLAFSHIGAYKLIHGIYKKRGLEGPSVSIAQNLQAFESLTSSPRNKFAVYLRNKLYNFRFIDRLARAKALDFIGINYYTRSLVDAQGWHWQNLLLDVASAAQPPLKKNTLGWDIYPQGLLSLLLKLARYRLPVFILENGICTYDDNQRWEFIAAHLENVHLALQRGVKILGYLYWSLIDNYEWDKGFGPRFGLIEVDYNNYQRHIRQSAKNFSAVCQTGRLKT